MCVLSQPVGNAGGYSYLYAVYEPICVAMRGRYNEDGKIQQKLEPRYDGLTNTITTVAKDNLVIETDDDSDDNFIKIMSKNKWW